MSLKNDIEKLEKECAAILSRCDNLSSVNRYFQHVVDGVLSMIDDNTNTEDIESLVNKALADSAVKNQKAWQRQIMNLVRDNIQKTQAFYKDRVNTRLDNLYQQTLKRKEVARISKLFSDNIRVANKAMKQGIIKETIKEIESGLLDSMRLRKNLEKKAGLPKHHAYTNSKMAVSAIAQEARNKVAEDAGLDYFYYYGEILEHSRYFCRLCINKTFSRKQLEMMSNGMLDPVMTFKGGYRCIHSLLGVNPAWDDDIKPVRGDSVKTIDTGYRIIKVVTSEEAIERLEVQDEMKKTGEMFFFNAQSNDTGFVAVHSNWTFKRDKALKNERKIYDEEFAAGQKLCEITGDVVEFVADVKNYRGGDVDLIWKERLIEVKTPQKMKESTILNRIRYKKKGQNYQSDDYLLNLQSCDDISLERVVRELKIWCVRYNKKLWIINNNEIIKVKQ
jgi:hypothetical protein